MSPDDTVPAGQPWYQSNGVRVAIGSIGAVLSGWLIASAGTHSFDWWALLAQEAGVFALLFAQLKRSDVVAPIDVLNGSNPRRLP